MRGYEMTKQKKCQNCESWHRIGDAGVGVGSYGGEFIKSEQITGFCEKHNEAKSAYDTCDDWEHKK
jgi:hypothetical protein